MAVCVSFRFLSLHRLLSVSYKHRDILVQLCQRGRTARFSTAFLRCKENEGDSSDASQVSSKLRRRRPLSPLERLSRLLPQEDLSPELLQLRDQNQQPQDADTQIPASPFTPAAADAKTQIPASPCTPATHDADAQIPASPCTSATHDAETQIPASPCTPATHDADAQIPASPCTPAAAAAGPELEESPHPEEGQISPTLPGESLLTFGELLIAEYRKNRRVEFRKMFLLERGKRLQSSWGIILHDDIHEKPAGCFLKTSRWIPLFIRRASLEDYVLYMKRGPAISYPKDAAAMLLMMDVTAGDCVLESGSGSGAMSLFLSRAVGSKGSVLSVEVREDHHRRAVLNYERWRKSWSLRRGQDWPDNVQFHISDLRAASSLLSGRGFNAAALDMINPHLALPAVLPHLHPGAVCVVYLANVTQVIDLLEGLRCSSLPFLCERVVEVPVRDWMVVPALQKDGRYWTRKAGTLDEDLTEDDEADKEEFSGDKGRAPAFGSVPYIARPHPEQMSHTAFLVKLRKCVHHLPPL
ncbi:tRNA (adenine(58)-N(1))-methyltransferase, mitochondrial [Cololabis saira]|uniref:tRNA (adenine(58)-N(1))-methyltransferase, mitochondrial n=1 Tax=Cololabis saira TaxID=129043 RepID=UPI002AD24216|nr:tRNA (adenine(58)-N(1))-methyltransferase, mitochondrial [Cololabis saira]